MRTESRRVLSTLDSLSITDDRSKDFSPRPQTFDKRYNQLCTDFCLDNRRGNNDFFEKKLQLKTLQSQIDMNKKPTRKDNSAKLYDLKLDYFTKGSIRNENNGMFSQCIYICYI